MPSILHDRVAAVRRILAVLVVVLAAGVAAGCGQKAAKPFLPAPTAECMRAQGFTVSTRDADVADVVATTAANGALRATPRGGGNTLILAFAADGQGAEDIEQAYRRFAPASLRPHLDDILSSRRNAVLKWTVSPSSEQQNAATGCLRT
jgi:hypothetical protein